MIKRLLGEWRTEKQLTYKEMAFAAGLSVSGYINIESGRRGPSRKVTAKIANRLKVKQEQIIWPIDASNCNTQTGTES